MPNRILKESVCTSDNLDALTPFQETFFYRLIVNCDDFGRMDARPKILAAKLFPLKRIRPGEVEKALAALSEAELVILYQVGGRPFLQMKSWERHQQIRAKMSRYPAPGDARSLAEAGAGERLISDDSGCSRNPIQEEINPDTNPVGGSPAGATSLAGACVQRGVATATTDQASTARGSGWQGVAMAEGEKGSFAPPSPDDVRAYCLEKDYQVDPERFCDFYASKGWKVGNQPMKDWRAAVRSWARRDKEGASPGGSAPGGKVVSQQQYQQRAYQNNFHAMDEMMKEFAQASDSGAAGR